jgi:hypothetical protein
VFISKIENKKNKLIKIKLKKYRPQMTQKEIVNKK